MSLLTHDSAPPYSQYSKQPCIPHRIGAVCFYEKKKSRRHQNVFQPRLGPGGETESALISAVPKPKRKPPPPQEEDKELDEKPKDKPDFGNFKGLNTEREVSDDAKPETFERCPSLKIEMINIGNRVAAEKDRLQRAKTELKTAQNELRAKQSEIAENSRMSKKEQKDARSAQNKMAAVGTVIGGIIGIPGGPFGIASGAVRGLAIGNTAGKVAEDAGDAINPNTETDITLSLGKDRLKKEEDEIRSRIELFQSRIESATSGVIRLDGNFQEARAVFMRCKGG